MVSLANRTLIWFKNAYCRVTLTKTALAFFLFTFAYCFVQSVVQSLLFELDSNACSLTSTIVTAAQVPKNVFAWLTENHNATTDSISYTLKLCDAIPFEKSGEDDPCIPIFDSDDPSVNEVPAGFRKRDSLFLKERDGNPPSSSENETATSSLPSDLSQALIQPIFNASTNNVSGVELRVPGIYDGAPITLNTQCTRVVLYADQVLRNSKREVWALIGAEFWLLSTSTLALLYGSIAHLCAALAFRILSVAWSAYSIWRTHDIDRRFDVLLTRGACGVDLFPNYFKPRITIQAVDLGLNVLALVLLTYLMIRLARTYSNIMYRCIGPPEHVVKIYRYVLGLFTCLQVSVYLLITSAALWLDQLINGAIAKISSHMTLYLAIFVVTLALLLPWIWIGWRSVRFEQRRLLSVFIGLGLLFEAAWSGMYDALVWRWTWIQWPFFASVTVASQVVLLASVVLGIVCRVNFGKGLKEYLGAADALEKADFEPEIFDSRQNVSDTGADDGWQADLERKIAADRLSQTLDFGAHQPAPPLSPPADYDVPITPRRDTARAAERAQESMWNAASRSRLPPAAEPARPLSFTSILPSLPKLDKNAPWKKPEMEDDGDGADLPRFRF